ncbi:hypothetical protein [Streptomyces sp. NBC_01304]|uniref:hypothetical protein n=1 Tax=Streptomyces sp. NBC_01304 TaxID=2903818 RepID=UPI002E0DAE05|nr:hypothetical protein OG430_02670 [Streptomyces sp. NBC_01304]
MVSTRSLIRSTAIAALAGSALLAPALAGVATAASGPAAAPSRCEAGQWQFKVHKLWDGGKAEVAKSPGDDFHFAQLTDKKGNLVGELDSVDRRSLVLKTGLKITLTKSGGIVQEWTVVHYGSGMAK